jgi:zinc D-Ala-D-Ala carboxypeptidase
MTHSEPQRTPTRWVPRSLVAGLLIVVPAMGAAIGYTLLAPSSSSSPSPTDASSTDIRRVDLDERGRGGATRAAGGSVPDGTTVFDDEIPAIANLDPALLAALRRAARDASRHGVELFVDSGWRSAEYQSRLFREAVSKYGSEEEAARWVATPDTSAHVSGNAVDVGPAAATAWLSRHGAKYGLCQIYGNESWHYELRPEAIDKGCPPPYADPTHDPRMRRSDQHRSAGRLRPELEARIGVPGGPTGAARLVPGHAPLDSGDRAPGPGEPPRLPREEAAQPGRGRPPRSA